MKTFLRATMLAILSLLPVMGAAEDVQCPPREAVTSYMFKEHGEQVHVRMLDSAGNMVELYANPDSGGWTLVVVTPDGCSTQAGAGTAYTVVVPEPGGDDT